MHLYFSQIATKVFDIQEIFYSHVITFILLVTLLVCLRDQMNQQKIQNEQSFNNRGHRKMWMILYQISSFRNQNINQDLVKYKYDLLFNLYFFITYPTKGSWELAFLKSNAFNIQWDDIKHKSMKPLAFA